MKFIKAHSFPKSQHLIGAMTINQLFTGGDSFVVFPVRVIVAQVPKCNEPVKVLISVPKKYFKHAVDRNRYKRLLRETYRLQNKTLLKMVDAKTYSLHVALVVVNAEKPTFSNTFRLMGKIMGKIEERLS